MKKYFIYILVILLILITGGTYFNQQLKIFTFSPTKSAIQPGIQLTEQQIKPSATTITTDATIPDIQVIAENLRIPWEIAFLPSGEMLVTQRPGRLLKFPLRDDQEKDLLPDPRPIEISGVAHVGEGGLLGLAVHPQFNQNQWIYLYHTTHTDTGLVNLVERYRLIDDQLTDKLIIIDHILGSQFHDGGRIKFGPDGYLYITTGDAQQSNLAQDINTLNGKILRLTENGDIPADNQFNNPNYSYGHRNVQGISWDDQNNLWATEHGRSGVQSGLDELNHIRSGQNYGWPEIQGDQTKTGITSPIVQSGPNDTWAPSGMVFWQGDIYFTGLRGQALYQYKIQTQQLIQHFRQQFGRLRTIVIGSDNLFYIATNNTDGRGEPQPGDDKIVRINPQIFKN